MGKTVRFLLVVCGGAILWTACEPEQRKVTPDMFHFPQSASGEATGEDLPEILFDSEVHDFDTIAIGEKVTHSYTFTNKGSAPLIIHQVRPSCGCTALKDWPQDPVAPGEGGKITVEFNSSGFPGPIEKTIQVSTNGVPRDWYLKLKGYVSGTEVIREQKAPIEMERRR